MKFAGMIGVRDGRGPCNRIAGECCQISLWEWSLGSDLILYKKAGHKRETLSPQLKRNSAGHPYINGGLYEQGTSVHSSVGTRAR